MKEWGVGLSHQPLQPQICMVEGKDGRKRQVILTKEKRADTLPPGAGSNVGAARLLYKLQAHSSQTLGRTRPSSPSPPRPT